MNRTLVTRINVVAVAVVLLLLLTCPLSRGWRWFISTVGRLPPLPDKVDLCQSKWIGLSPDNMWMVSSSPIRPCLPIGAEARKVGLWLTRVSDGDSIPVGIDTGDIKYEFKGWSPDSSMLAFATGTKLWVTMPEKPEEHTLVYEHDGWDVAWTPDGTELVVVDGLGKAVLVNADGGGYEVLMEEGEMAPYPVNYCHWDISPDGTKIVYAAASVEWTSEHLYVLQVWVKDIETHERTLLIANDKEASVFYPVWSPDGKRIAVEENHVLLGVSDPYTSEAPPQTDE